MCNFCHFSDAMKDTSENMIDTVEKIKKIMGEARNYGEYELLSLQSIFFLRFGSAIIQCVTIFKNNIEHKQ